MKQTLTVLLLLAGFWVHPAAAQAQVAEAAVATTTDMAEHRPRVLQPMRYRALPHAGTSSVFISAASVWGKDCGYSAGAGLAAKKNGVGLANSAGAVSIALLEPHS